MMGGQGQLALNQLLVVMDGIDNPPFTKKFFTNRINTFLDATYIVPRRVRGRSLRMPPPRPRTEQIYFIGATNVPLEALDPALTRPGRMGRYVWLRTPTKKDRLDIFDLYLKVSHDPELDSEKRRDEIARITNGYSPAMIEQVCSMALTYAHHEGKPRFGWEEIVEAMTTIESGMAINIEYIPEETRAIAVHEAGHAVAGHAYMKGAESTRLSIRRRGEALGHHQALEKEERFSSWRSEELARLIWTLGAMAAERVFYGENSTGVGGDVQSATARSAWMVGACAMAPERIEFADGFKPPKGKTEDEVREEIAKKYQRIGDQIMNRSGGGMHGDPLGGVMGDPSKRAMASQLLGQAYVAAHQLIEHNRDGVAKVADTLVERRELHGDEILKLLESINLEVPLPIPSRTSHGRSCSPRAFTRAGIQGGGAAAAVRAPDGRSRRALHDRLCGDRRDGPRAADHRLHEPRLRLQLPPPAGSPPRRRLPAGARDRDGDRSPVPRRERRAARGRHGADRGGLRPSPPVHRAPPRAQQAAHPGRRLVVQPGETALFSFCGLAGEQNCSLPGQPTPERLMLLRREAVELSYYTFKLLPEIETVVSLLPPVPRGEGQPPQTIRRVLPAQAHGGPPRQHLTARFRRSRRSPTAT